MKQKGLAAVEARLAIKMLIPAFLIVFAVIIFPVIANIWLSFKPVRLGDLRPPRPVLNEQVLSVPENPGDTLEFRYIARNSSGDNPLTDVTVRGNLPPGLAPIALPESCGVEEGSILCEFDRWEGGFQEQLVFRFEASQAFFDASVRASSPTGPVVDARAQSVLTNFEFTLDNFRHVLSGRQFWPALGTTFTYTLFGTLGSIVLGLFAAQLLNARFFGRRAIRGLLLFPYVAPVIALAFTWRFMLNPLNGTINVFLQGLGLEEPISFLSERTLQVTLAGIDFHLPLAITTVIAFEAWRYFPFAFLFLLARLQAVPDQLYESAEVDGATSFQKFFRITIPQLSTVLSTLFVLRFMWTFNKFDDVFLLTGGAAGTRTLPIQVYDNAFGRADIGAGAAVAVLLFIFLGIFLVGYFRVVPEAKE